jgi:UDP-N-acetylglucosamine/UDP-N-acetylgalactosamine diphosphorylase
MGGAGKGGNVAFRPGIFRGDKRIVVNNINYIANLIALKQWYDQVRTLFISNRFPRALLEALQEKVDLAIGERIIRLEAVCLKEPADDRKDQAPDLPKQARELDERWPEIKESLKLQPANSTSAASKDQFLESIRQGISAHGHDYIRVIQRLDPADSAKGTRWLQGIVDDIITASKKILPSFF